MDEATEPRTLENTSARRRKIDVRPLGGLIFIGVLVLIIVGVVGIHNVAVAKQKLKHEAADAKVLAAQVVTALGTQNTASLVALGDKQFQSTNSASGLDTKLTFQSSPPITFAQMYGDTKPTVDQQLVVNNSRGQHVAFVYKYDKLKAPFYVHVDTVKSADGKWQLQALGASSDELKLLQKS